MKKIILTLMFLIIYVPAYAASPGCPDRDRTPIINVRTTDAGVQYEYGLSSEEIMHVGGSNANITANTRGLTYIRLQTRASFSVVTLTNGKTKCAFPASVDVFIGYELPQYVYIDKRYAPGSCQFEVIRNHENEHVRINRETLALIVSVIRKGLTDAVMNNGYPIVVPSADAGNQAITGNLEEVFKSYIAAHIQQRNTMNAMMDTPQNYAATSRLCPYW